MVSVSSILKSGRQKSVFLRPGNYLVSAIAKIETGCRPVSDIEITGIMETLGIELSWLFTERKDWFRHQPEQGSI